MASRLVVRGSKLNYVNKNGNTALHLCIENDLKEAVEFLIYQGADPHIMDLQGQDACDKAKKSGMAMHFPIFNDCNIHKKVLPILPDGRQVEVNMMPDFKKQMETR